MKKRQVGGQTERKNRAFRSTPSVACRDRNQCSLLGSYREPGPIEHTHRPTRTERTSCLIIRYQSDKVRSKQRQLKAQSSPRRSLVAKNTSSNVTLTFVACRFGRQKIPQWTSSAIAKPFPIGWFQVVASHYPAKHDSRDLLLKLPIFTAPHQSTT